MINCSQYRADLLLQDYYASIYVAEIVNSLTNVVFMYLGIKGCLSCWRNQHDDIFVVAFAGYLLVGAGSFLFHATLKCTSVSSDMHRFMQSLWLILSIVSTTRSNAACG